MYLHYNYILIVMQYQSLFGDELIERLYAMKNQLVIIVKDTKLSLTYSAKYPRLNIIIGDLKDENSTHDLIKKCNTIFPIVDMMFNLDFEMNSSHFSQSHENPDSIHTNYDHLIKGLLPKFTVAQQPRMILFDVVEKGDIKLRTDRSSSFDNEALIIHRIPIDKKMSAAKPHKLVQQLITDLAQNRLKNQNQLLDKEKKMEKWRNLFRKSGKK